MLSYYVYIYSIPNGRFQTGHSWSIMFPHWVNHKHEATEHEKAKCGLWDINPFRFLRWWNPSELEKSPLKKLSRDRFWHFLTPKHEKVEKTCFLTPSPTQKVPVRYRVSKGGVKNPKNDDFDPFLIIFDPFGGSPLTPPTHEFETPPESKGTFSIPRKALSVI